jgi:glutaredoxin
MSAPTFELWQTEWCPASHRVPQRLTELGLTYTVHQVPVERDARAQLEHASGRRTIPILVTVERVIDGEPYLILGACNPPLARAALEAEPELGVLLPCNVVVFQQEGNTHIVAVDAEQMLSIVGNEELAGTASEVKRRLSDVVDRAARS